MLFPRKPAIPRPGGAAVLSNLLPATEGPAGDQQHTRPPTEDRRHPLRRHRPPGPRAASHPSAADGRHEVAIGGRVTTGATLELAISEARRSQ